MLTAALVCIPALPKIFTIVSDAPLITFGCSIKSSCENSDLIIIHTEWNDFKSIDFKRIMKKNNFKVFDMRNIYSAEKMKKDKVKYFSIGR